MILEAVIGVAAASLVGTVVSIVRMRARNEREEKARCPTPLPDLNTIKLGMRVQLRPQIAAERNRGLFEPLPGLSYREGARPISRRWEGVIQDFRLPLMVDEEVAISKMVTHPVAGRFGEQPRPRTVVSDAWSNTQSSGHVQDFPRDSEGYSIAAPLDEEGWSRVEKSDENYNYVGAGTEYSVYPRGLGETMFTILWDHGATTDEPASDLLRVMP